MTNLDPIQNQAVERALAIAAKGGAFKLLGKAGTGKTTTGLAIVERLLDAGYKVACCAYANKAVNRMKQVGYPAKLCRTVNRLLYTTGINIRWRDWQFTEKDADKILRLDVKNPDDRTKMREIFDKVGLASTSTDPVLHQRETSALRFSCVKDLKAGKAERVSGTVIKTDEQLAKDGLSRKTVIVVDELSMLPLDMADDLHGTFDVVIYIGDPGQLPPVNSVDTCRYLGSDDSLQLMTVHRVQGNSHLLDLIYRLDEGKIPEHVTPISIETFQAMAKQDYQFICYTNDGVAWINQETRRCLGRSGIVQPGEPLITVTRARAERHVAIDDQNRKWFLDNEVRLSGQYTSSRGMGGAVYTREKNELVSVTVYRAIQKNMILECTGAPIKTDSSLWLVPVTVEGEDSDKDWLVRTVAFWDASVGKKRAFRRVGSSMKLDFSYAITAHKAQGSEWPKVAVMLRQAYTRDLGNADSLDEIKRWNYTAATRGRQDIQLFTSIIGCQYG